MLIALISRSKQVSEFQKLAKENAILKRTVKELSLRNKKLVYSYFHLVETSFFLCSFFVSFFRPCRVLLDFYLPTYLTCWSRESFALENVLLPLILTWLGFGCWRKCHPEGKAWRGIKSPNQQNCHSWGWNCQVPKRFLHFLCFAISFLCSFFSH